MRILIAISPRMYREALALSVHRDRPDSVVLLAPPPASPDRWAEVLKADVLIRDDEEGGAPPAQEVGDGLVCRVRLRVAGRVDAAVEMDGAVSEIRDASLEDVFSALDAAELRTLGRVRDYPYPLP